MNRSTGLKTKRVAMKHQKRMSYARCFDRDQVGMMDVFPDQLKLAVESQHDCTATLVQSVPVTERAVITSEKAGLSFTREETVWDGVVYVFDLTDQPEVRRAYAWSEEIDGKPRFLAVLHLGPIKGPTAAVREALKNG
jgi:hypothetical protein